MPEHQEAGTYRLQAKMWQEKAGNLPCSEERDVCLLLADGYAHLAQFIEQKTSVNTHMEFNLAPDHGQHSIIG